MILQNMYYYFKSALSDEHCNSIIELGLDRMEQTKKEYGAAATLGTTGDKRDKTGEAKTIPMGEMTLEELEAKGLSEKETHIRDSNVSWLSDEWIYRLIHPYIHTANKEAGWNFEWDWSEACQFTKYDEGQFYGWHADADDRPYNNDPNSGFSYTENPNIIGKVRKLSVTVNLTDPNNFTGGDLKFDFGPHRGKDRLCTVSEIRPKGSIIVFPSHLFHQVTTITSGTRYSLVMWNLGAPFK